MITQVVPHIDATDTIVSDFRAALTASAPDTIANFTSLEGYIVGRIFIKALRELKGPVTRESVVGALEQLGDFELRFGRSRLRITSTDHQACHTIWPTVIRDGAVVPLAWTEFVNLRELRDNAGH